MINKTIKIFKPTFAKLFVLLLAFNLFSMFVLVVNWNNSSEKALENRVSLSEELLVQNKLLTKIRESFYELRLDIKHNSLVAESEKVKQINKQREDILRYMNSYIHEPISNYELSIAKGFIINFDHSIDQWEMFYQDLIAGNYDINKLNQLTQISESLQSHLDALLDINFSQGERVVQEASKIDDRAKKILILIMFSITSSVLMVYFYVIKIARKLESELNYIAYNDALTGLPNRKSFQLNYEKAIEKNKEMQGAMLFLDIDNFKTVNDTFGHDMGDSVLIDFSCKISNTIRKTDLISRLGGDEFVVFLVDIETKEEVEIIAKRILDVLDKKVEEGESSVHVTGSVGISYYPLDAVEISMLMKRADQAMYIAKEKGKNMYHFWSEQIEEE